MERGSKVTTAWFCLLVMAFVLLVSMTMPLLASSLQDEHHEHSEMMELYNQEFHNELWRLPDPQKLIYDHLRWVLGATVFLWIVFLTTEPRGMMRRKRRGAR